MGRISLQCGGAEGGVLCPAGCLPAPLPSLHWMEVAPPPLSVKAKNISRPWQMAPGAKSPQRNLSCPNTPCVSISPLLFSCVEDWFLVCGNDRRGCHECSRTCVLAYMSRSLTRVSAGTQPGWVAQRTQPQGDELRPNAFQEVV